MKAVEFEATVNTHGQIVLPRDVARAIPPDEPVRVVVMWDARPAGSAWREAMLQTGDAVLIRMEFHQAPGSKVRPALVLLDTGDSDFVAAPVTSQARSADFDVALLDWRVAGLNVPSSCRLHKLTMLPKSDVVRKLGSSSALIENYCMHHSVGHFARSSPTTRVYRPGGACNSEPPKQFSPSRASAGGSALWWFAGAVILTV